MRKGTVDCPPDSKRTTSAILFSIQCVVYGHIEMMSEAVQPGPFELPDACNNVCANVGRDSGYLLFLYAPLLSAHFEGVCQCLFSVMVWDEGCVQTLRLQLPVFADIMGCEIHVWRHVHG